MWVPFLASLPAFVPAFKTRRCESPRAPVTLPSPPLDAALHPPKTTTARFPGPCVEETELTWSVGLVFQKVNGDLSVYQGSLTLW